MNPIWQKRIHRIFKAFTYSMQGLKVAIKQPPFQDELIACAILIPIAFWVDVTVVERLLLLGTLLSILVAEIFNTAIELLVDRISLEIHPISEKIKDLGSAGVFLCMTWTGITWLWILCS